MSVKVFRIRVRHDFLHEILSWIYRNSSNHSVRFLNLGDSLFDRSPERYMWMYLECPTQLDYLLFKERYHVLVSDIDPES